MHSLPCISRLMEHIWIKSRFPQKISENDADRVVGILDAVILMYEREIRFDNNCEWVTVCNVWINFWFMYSTGIDFANVRNSYIETKWMVKDTCRLHLHSIIFIVFFFAGVVESFVVMHEQTGNKRSSTVKKINKNNAFGSKLGSLRKIFFNVSHTNIFYHIFCTLQIHKSTNW